MRKNSIRMVRSLVAIAATALVAGACSTTNAKGSADGSGEDGQQIKLTIAAENEPVLPYSKLLQDFFVPELEKRVAEQTSHTVEVTEAYGTIAGPGEMLNALETGLADIGGHSCFCLNPAELYPYMLSFHVPFSSPDPEIVLPAFRKVLDEVPEMGAIYEDNHNQKLLAAYGSSDYGLITKFPVDAIEDVRGRSLSAVGPNLQWIPADALNVTVVQGTLSDWYTALQTGLYEGAVIHAEGANGFKLQEVTDYYTIGGFGAMAWGSLNINLDTFEGLPSDVQQIILDLAAEYEEKYPVEIVAARDAALEAIEAEGVEISEFDPEVREEWANALPEIPKMNMEEAVSRGFDWAPEAYEIFIAAQEEAGYTFPREWKLR